jgi:hypothetical protein
MSQHATLHALGLPQPVVVRVDCDGQPCVVAGGVVETVREEWRVEEGWWTDQPARRRYFELVLTSGRVMVVFEDRRAPGQWYTQTGV